MDDRTGELMPKKPVDLGDEAAGLEIFTLIDTFTPAATARQMEGVETVAYIESKYVRFPCQTGILQRKQHRGVSSLEQSHWRSKLLFSIFFIAETFSLDVSSVKSKLAADFGAPCDIVTLERVEM
jgi:hypothetical protein